jgi:hypothetical protein
MSYKYLLAFTSVKIWEYAQPANMVYKRYANMVSSILDISLALVLIYCRNKSNVTKVIKLDTPDCRVENYFLLSVFKYSVYRKKHPR